MTSFIKGHRIKGLDGHDIAIARPWRVGEGGFRGSEVQMPKIKVNIDQLE